MKRIAWDQAQRRRCRIRWIRAGMPLPNRITDPTPYRLVFFRDRYRLRLRRRRLHDIAAIDELREAVDGAFDGVDVDAYMQAVRGEGPDYTMPDGRIVG
jgi:hypothetical protein